MVSSTARLSGILFIYYEKEHFVLHCSALRYDFQKLKTLPRMPQYALSQLMCVVNNRDHFLINSEIHNINARHSSNLHLPSANLDVYHKGVYCSGIKIFNRFPFSIKKNWGNPRTFKSALTFRICEIILFIRWYNNNSNKYWGSQIL